MTVTISHDAFARYEVVRRRVHVSVARGCDWCGAAARPLKRGDARQFQYGTRQDDDLQGYIHWHRGLFCGKSCRDSYHT